MDFGFDHSQPMPEKNTMFNSVHWQNIDWRKTSFDKNTGDTVFETELSLNNCRLVGTLDRRKTSTAWIDSYIIDVYDRLDQKAISGSVVFYQPFDHSVTGTIDAGIERTDRYLEDFGGGKVVLPHGSGIAFYEKLMELMQSVSNDDGSTYVHTVKARPKGLTADEWSAHFSPVLTRHGYNELTWDRWERTYSPE